MLHSRKKSRKHLISVVFLLECFAGCLFHPRSSFFLCKRVICPFFEFRCRAYGSRPLLCLVFQVYLYFLSDSVQTVLQQHSINRGLFYVKHISFEMTYSKLYSFQCFFFSNIALIFDYTTPTLLTRLGSGSSHCRDCPSRDKR